MNLPFQYKWTRKEKWMHAGALRQNIFLFSLNIKANCLRKLKIAFEYYR